jgi:hypothetical protein
MSSAAGQAIEVFHELRDQAAAAGLVMATNTVALEPSKALADAIAYSASKAAAQE